MKLSELISNLQDIIDKRGDVDVKAYSNYYNDWKKPHPLVERGVNYDRPDINVIILKTKNHD